jgi:hemerythrin superfamily protein
MPSTKQETAANTRQPHRERPSGGTAQSKRPDAIALLKQDHREVKTLFGEYERARADTKKTELARDICLALTVHAQIEEDIFYPAVRKATGDDDLLDEAAVEHAAAKQLIAEIEAMSVDEELYDAKVKVLSEQIDHHVEEEEEKLFPEVQKTNLDLAALGEELATRKAELMAELGA